MYIHITLSQIIYSLVIGPRLSNWSETRLFRDETRSTAGSQATPLRTFSNHREGFKRLFQLWNLKSDYVMFIIRFSIKDCNKIWLWIVKTRNPWKAFNSLYETRWAFCVYMGLKGLYGPRSAKMSLAGLKVGEVCQHEWWEGRLQVQGGGRHRHSRRCGKGRRTEEDIWCFINCLNSRDWGERHIKLTVWSGQQISLG